MAEIFDQITDEMLQNPPPKHSRAETLALLTQIFAPVGPAENLLIEDLATVRTQIQQADSRRESLYIIQHREAVKLFGLQEARESADLETLWTTDPGHFHQLMRQDVLFLNKHVRLWRSLVSVCEDPAATPSPRLTAGILRANAQPRPAEELDAETFELVRLAIALQKNPENFARSLQSALGTELPLAELARQLPDATQARQKLLRLAQSLCQQAESALATATQRQAIAQSHFSNYHHAGKDHLESLKLILTDIRHLQIRYDKTLRTLYFLQQSRKREADRAAERARRAAEKAAEKARKEAEKAANPPGTHTSQRKSAVTLNRQSIDHINSSAVIDSSDTSAQPSGTAAGVHDEIQSLEAQLANGSIPLPRADQIRDMFRLWADRELFDHSRRFRTTFRHFREGYLLNRIKEIAAHERESRHDQMKITEEHEAG